MASTTPPCRICSSATAPAGSKYSEFSGRRFHLAQCPSCRYGFVVDPRTDFENVYGADYYAGRGADPHVSYVADIQAPGSVQEYEWRGILSIVASFGALAPGARWLDYGCGMGGLLRYALARGHDVFGFDEGFAAVELRRAGLPAIDGDELDAMAGTFDVVTAIEVVEHVLDPLDAFSRMATLLRPGGLLFLTTGNAKPYRGRLPSWQYVRPEVHVSFYEPETLERCMRHVGLRPAPAGYRAGFTPLIRSKILRTVGVQRRNIVERCVPWSVVARLADRRFGVTQQPIAWRPPSPA